MQHADSLSAYEAQRQANIEREWPSMPEPVSQATMTAFMRPVLLPLAYTGNRQALESLGLIDGGNLIPKKGASKPSGLREKKVWPHSDRIMRDARCLTAPKRLSPGEPGREFSRGGSYLPDGIESYHVTTEHPSNMTNIEMKSKQAILDDRRQKAMTMLSSEMAKQPIEPPGLLEAIREVETTTGTDAALQAREALSSAVGLQVEHDELVQRLDAHMQAKGITGMRMHTHMQVSATTFYIWRGRTAQKITERLAAAVDEAVAAYLAGVAMGIDAACNRSETGPNQERQDGSSASIALSRASSVRPGYASRLELKDPVEDLEGPLNKRLRTQVDFQEPRYGTLEDQPRYWTADEHRLFLEAVQHFGRKDVESIAQHVGTRTPTQVRTHAQKFFLRQPEMEKMQQISTMAFEVTPGMAVEVRQAEEGLVGSTYEATVIELRGVPGSNKQSEALVEYKTLFDDETQAPPCPVLSERVPKAVVWNIPGQCGTPGCHLPDFHDGPCSPFCALNGLRERRGGDGAPSVARLREWVKASSLLETPKMPLHDWHKSLNAGSKAEMLHDGGFWQVVVRQRLPDGGKSKKGSRFVVRAVGYSIEHTVNANALRPHTA